MCRKMLLLLFLVVGLSAGAAEGAVPIEVENYSFELPGTVKQKCWDGETGSYVDVPGWTDGPAVAGDSGVEPNERGFIPSDGDWGGFLKSDDPPVYNLTNHVIGVGDVYELQIDIGGNSGAVNFQLALYYDDDGTRVIVESNDLEVPNRRNTTKLPYSLSFTASDDPNCYNHRIGIQLDNIDTTSSWAGFDYVWLTLMDPILRAVNLYPAHMAAVDTTDVTLSWRAGDTADKHHLYIGENFDDVKNGTGGTDKGLIDPNNYQPQDLVNGKTYFWRIDEVEANGTTVHPGVVWNFSVAQKNASNPVPANGAVLVDPNVTLSWSAGSGAISRDVYFGTVSPPPPISPGQTTTTYDPSGDLEYETMYYWRIDEFDGTNTYPGDLWSFTTIREIPITDPNLLGWWSFDEDEDTIAVDISGNGNHGQIRGEPNYVAGYDANAMEFDGVGDYVAVTRMVQDDFTLMAWIKTDQPGAGQVGDTAREGSGLLWSGAAAATSNFFLLAVLDTKLAFRIGTDNVTSNGDVVTGDWTHVAVTRTQSTGQVELFINSSTDTTAVMGTGSLTDNPAIVIGTNLLDKWYYTGLIDDVRIYDKALTQEEVQQAMRINLLLAWQPYPAYGSTPGLEDLTPFSWMPGDSAAEHDIYLGTDPIAVGDANASDITGIYRGRQPQATYTPSEALQPGQTYYWRVDEVNAPPDLTVFEGDVWSFTVGNFLVVDDFEDYNDTEPYTVWNAWRDGYGDPENGSQVGHDDEPYAELAIVHGGNQSMPVDYNNITAEISTATRTLVSGRDWTRKDVEALSLWFRGYPASVGSFTEGPAGTYTMTATGADIWGQADEFHFAYKMLSGVGAIEAQVLGVDDTDPWAKAGVMIRDTLEPGSVFAAAYVTPGNGVRYQARLDRDADAQGDTDVATEEQIAITAPYWVRIERDIAGEFTCFYSSNGSDWQLMAWSPQNIQMSTDLYVGLALTSHNVDATCEAQFSNVAIEGDVSGDWMSQDIGIQSNDPEPMYVAVANNTGTPAVVYHDDPNATQVDDWTEWNIDLKDFEGQGVDLADVNSITIGFGNNDNAQASGAGTMYFDDIRLYQPRCVPDKLTLAEADLNSDCVVDLRDLEILSTDWLLADDLIVTSDPGTDGLVGHWMLDGNANDSSGNGNHGTLNGSPQWISTGHIGGALQLDGDDDYVDLPIGALISSLTDCTVAVWVDWSGQGDPWQRVFDFGTGENVYMFLTPSISGTGEMRFSITTASGGESQLNAPEMLPTGWHHVAVAIDGTSANMALYLDGAAVISGPTETLPTDLGETTQNWLGRSQWVADPNLDGSLDDFRIYNRALSKQEIAYLGDLTPGDGQVYVPLLSSAELYGAEPQGSKSINFKDFAVLADQWLKQQVWPQP